MFNSTTSSSSTQMGICPYLAVLGYDHQYLELHMDYLSYEMEYS